jgi:hypothetical protein
MVVVVGAVMGAPVNIMSSSHAVVGAHVRPESLPPGFLGPVLGAVNCRHIAQRPRDGQTSPGADLVVFVVVLVAVRLVRMLVLLLLLLMILKMRRRRLPPRKHAGRVFCLAHCAMHPRFSSAPPLRAAGVCGTLAAF